MFDTSEEAFRKKDQSIEDLIAEHEKKRAKIEQLKGDISQFLVVKDEHPMMVFVTHGMLTAAIDEVEQLSKAAIKLEYRILRQKLQIDFLRGVRWIISEQAFSFRHK